MSFPDPVLLDFGDSGHPPLRLPRGANLSEHLTVQNSPVLFGCRTGICGTCLVRAWASGQEPLDPPGPEEAELLKILSPETDRARLACQLFPTADMRLERL